MMEALREEILFMLEPFFVSRGFELVAVDLVRGGREHTVKVLADRPQGGITIDECALLNQGIRELLDNANILDGDYALEVSSPGMDRPLLCFKDFLRACGKEVTVYLKEPIAGRLEYQGTIEKVDAEGICLKSEGAQVMIAFRSINKGKQVI